VLRSSPCAARRLRWRTPKGLEPEAGVRLAFAPADLAVTPDGAAAYAFEALGDRLVAIDLAAGQTGEPARVPGHRPWGLAAAADRPYVASPTDGRVWAFDRATGRRVATHWAGRAPAGMALLP
jgi:DNA-binding beta-propeller fold protein YncE